MKEKSVNEIKKEFECLSPEEWEERIPYYRDDPRKGVQSFLDAREREIKKREAERRRIEKLCEYEKKYADYDFICGIDEVGRGPLAGPVVAAAVILPKDCRIPGINDSKKLSAKKREALCARIKEEAVSLGLGYASPECIDRINILNATYEAMRQAVSFLTPRPSLLLVDAVCIPDISIPQVSIIKGDAKSISIGAASIVAKVTRDQLMTEYDALYPGYGFVSNKGYGSREHMEALKKLGPTPIHRTSFIRSIL